MSKNVACKFTTSEIQVFFYGSDNLLTHTLTNLPKVRDGVWEGSLGGDVCWHSGVMLNLKGQKETKGRGSVLRPPLTLEGLVTRATGHSCGQHTGRLNRWSPLLQQKSGDSKPTPPELHQYSVAMAMARRGFRNPRQSCTSLRNKWILSPWQPKGRC